MPQVTLAQAAEVEAARKVIELFSPGGPVWVLVGCFVVLGAIFVGLLLWFLITRSDRFLLATQASMKAQDEQAKRQNDILEGQQRTLETQNKTLEAVVESLTKQETLLQEVHRLSRKIKAVEIDDHPHLPAPE